MNALYIKRDDLNGSVLGGNKIRKIEFTLAKAISEGKNHVLTWGSIKSNHCRTTALVCAQLGLKCTLLQTSDGNPEDLVTEGNVLLSMMTEARCIVCPNDTDFGTAKVMMGEIMKKIEEEGDKPCLIDRGGTQPDAVFAYIDAFNEILLENEKLDENEKFTDIFVTSGSGGTMASLIIATNLSKSGIKIHGHRVWGNNSNFEEIFDEELHGLGVSRDLIKPDSYECHDFLVCGGYGETCSEINDLVLKSPAKTGVPLCTTYTGKTAAAMLRLMREKGENFNGRKVVFLHTGGVPGLWGDHVLAESLKRKFREEDAVVKVEEYLK